MHRVAGGLEEEFPSTNRNWGARIERLDDSMFDPRVRLSLLVLLGAVGVVLMHVASRGNQESRKTVGQGALPDQADPIGAGPLLVTATTGR